MMEDTAAQGAKRGSAKRQRPKPVRPQIDWTVWTWLRLRMIADILDHLHAVEYSYNALLVVEHAAQPKRDGRRGLPGSSGILTRRQEQIAGLIAKGLGTRQIAARLGISPEGAQNTINVIRARTGARDRAQIVLWVQQHLRQEHDDV